MLNTAVTRNGVTKQLTKSTFGKKSPNAGKEFYYPAIELPTIEEDLKFLGLDEVANVLDKEYRLVFADIYLDNVNPETGEVDEAQMQEDWANFTAGVQKLSDIEDQLDTLQAEQQKYALDDNFSETDDEGKPTVEALDLQAKVKEIAKKIKPLRGQKATIEAKYKVRSEARKAKKAAAAAKAKAEVAV